MGQGAACPKVYDNDTYALQKIQKRISQGLIWLEGVGFLTLFAGLLGASWAVPGPGRTCRGFGSRYSVAGSYNASLGRVLPRYHEMVRQWAKKENQGPNHHGVYGK